MPVIQRRIGVLFGVFFLLLLLAGARSFYLGMLGRGSTAIAPAVDPGSERAGPSRRPCCAWKPTALSSISVSSASTRHTCASSLALKEQHLAYSTCSGLGDNAPSRSARLCARSGRLYVPPALCPVLLSMTAVPLQAFTMAYGGHGPGVVPALMRYGRRRSVDDGPKSASESQL